MFLFLFKGAMWFRVKTFSNVCKVSKYINFEGEFLPLWSSGPFLCFCLLLPLSSFHVTSSPTNPFPLLPNCCHITNGVFEIFPMAKKEFFLTFVRYFPKIDWNNIKFHKTLMWKSFVFMLQCTLLSFLFSPLALPKMSHLWVSCLLSPEWPDGFQQPQFFYPNL